MRELEALEKERVFSYTLIRLQFPDRTTLVAAFHPNETVGAVAEVVAGVLEAPPKQLTLFTSPPRTVLSPANTLRELGLVPAALIYVSLPANTPTQELLSAKARLLLDESMAQALAAGSAAAAAKAMLPASVPVDAEASRKRDAAAAAADKRSGGQGAKKTGAGKRPAWMKL